MPVAIKKLESDKSGGFTLDVAFNANEGITILFGQSGSGKTTTLRAIAGIVTPDAGTITIGVDIYFDSATGKNLSIQKRRVGYVFQDYALFPHMTAEQNIAYGIKDNERRASRLERVRIPFIYVTHNTSEAIRLGSQVVVLDEGRVQPIGRPSKVFDTYENER